MGHPTKDQHCCSVMVYEVQKGFAWNVLWRSPPGVIRWLCLGSRDACGTLPYNQPRIKYTIIHISTLREYWPYVSHSLSKNNSKKKTMQNHHQVFGVNFIVPWFPFRVFGFAFLRSCVNQYVYTFGQIHITYIYLLGFVCVLSLVP